MGGRVRVRVRETKQLLYALTNVHSLTRYSIGFPMGISITHPFKPIFTLTRRPTPNHPLIINEPFLERIVPKGEDGMRALLVFQIWYKVHKLKLYTLKHSYVEKREDLTRRQLEILESLILDYRNHVELESNSEDDCNSRDESIRGTHLKAS